MHRGPDVIEKLNLNHRLQSPRGHADSPADNVCFSERGIEDTRTAKLPLQVGSYFKDSAFAFDLIEILLARAISHVFTKNYDPGIAGHFRMQATIDQVDHRARVAGKLR